jgi:hypothetical protein
MTSLKQKIITSLFITVAVVGGFEALIYIINLNETGTFLWLAAVLWIYLWIKITLLYDLHFNNPGAIKRARAKHENVGHWLSRIVKIFATALWDRASHFRQIRLAIVWANYLLLPGIIFWSTVAFFYLNLGRIGIQQVFAGLSSLAIVVACWHINEIYTRKEEKVSLNAFATLSAIKIYGVLLTYAAIFSLTRYYCMPIKYLFLGIFASTFLIIYQALFQHKQTGTNRNLFWTFLISLTLSVLAWAIYPSWGYNNLTAAVFLTAFYNLFWNVFHHSLENHLSRRLFWETVFVSLFIGLMALSLTNFKARILPGCF